MNYSAILLQRDSEDGIFQPVYYASGKTTIAEEKYSDYELEMLAIIKALKKFAFCWVYHLRSLPIAKHSN